MKGNPWVPTGARKDLNFERRPSPGTGSWTPGGWKLCWHITVSPWMAVDSMVSVLKSKGAEPHFVIGGRPGFAFPVVVQLLPLTEWGKALAHPSGTPETNKCHTVQIEICARPGNVRQEEAVGNHPYGSTLFDFDSSIPNHIYSHMRQTEDPEEFELCMKANEWLQRQFNSGVAGWTDSTYKALANLTSVIDWRVPIPKERPRRFDKPVRFSPAGWVAAKGHVGHSLCPNNDHFDPTPAFDGLHLVNLRKAMPKDGWAL
jgi:hypothetical protein